MHNYLYGCCRCCNAMLSFKCLLSIQATKVCTTCSAVLEPWGIVFESCLFLNSLDGDTDATKVSNVVSSTTRAGNRGPCIVLAVALSPQNVSEKETGRQQGLIKKETG